jgi:hypothetical protein
MTTREWASPCSPPENGKGKRCLRRSAIRHLILEVTSFPTFEAVVEVPPVVRRTAFAAIAS